MLGACDWEAYACGLEPAVRIGLPQCGHAEPVVSGFSVNPPITNACGLGEILGRSRSYESQTVSIGFVGTHRNFRSIELLTNDPPASVDHGAGEGVTGRLVART